MKSALLVALTLSAALCAGSVFAAEKTLTPQQERMKTCNADPKAKTLKGDERKAFMSACLKGDSTTAAPAAAPAPAKPMTQQEKMKACNADPKAKTLHGDERKAFMSSCLKSDNATAAAPTH
ncbi:MAG: PsiF repeat-containing protein [Gammaproteobacteria bacterium]|nr:MAG: PsiF repeat-containing protein [Gammaproteobacteria bacterium]